MELYVPAVAAVEEIEPAQPQRMTQQGSAQPLLVHFETQEHA